MENLFTYLSAALPLVLFVLYRFQANKAAGLSKNLTKANNELATQILREDISSLEDSFHKAKDASEKAASEYRDHLRDSNKPD